VSSDRDDVSLTDFQDVHRHDSSAREPDFFT
jgi:hypothetical protein